MADLALLIDRDGASLDAGDGEVLVLRLPGGQCSRVGTCAVDSVVVDADAMLSTRALRGLARHGVALVLVGQGRQAPMHWAQPGAAGARWRHAQHLSVDVPGRRLVLAKAMLRAKFEAQADLLAELGRVPVPPSVASAGQRLATAEDAAELRGIEGAAARAYWAAWGRLWPAGWGFKGRNRRPPGDPLNALLSLGYTLATGEATRQVAQVGLDPWLGVLHETRPPAPAMALDVVEGARAIVDGWVLHLVHRIGLKPGDFERESDGGVRLLPDKRREVYIDWFAHGLPPVRQRLRQVLQEVTALLQGLVLDHNRSAWMEPED